MLLSVLLCWCFWPKEQLSEGYSFGFRPGPHPDMQGTYLCSKHLLSKCLPEGLAINKYGLNSSGMPWLTLKKTLVMRAIQVLCQSNAKFSNWESVGSHVVYQFWNMCSCHFQWINGYCIKQWSWVLFIDSSRKIEDKSTLTWSKWALQAAEVGRKKVKVSRTVSRVVLLMLMARCRELCGVKTSMFMENL